MLCRAIGNQFVEGRQEDAAEFMEYVIAHMQRAAFLSQSSVGNLFQGVSCIRTICINCGRESQVKDEFTILKVYPEAEKCNAISFSSRSGILLLILLFYTMSTKK